MVASRSVHSLILQATAPASPSLGVYVHVPFCTKRCYYCAFNTAPMDDEAMARYLRALLREIDLLGTADWAPRVRIGSVFFGGGTPSLLTAEDLTSIVDRLRGTFSVDDAAEITVECNPESVDRAKLGGYRAAGVNRLSLGVQSLDDAILDRIGRLHGRHGARAAFDAAREAGFTNVSIDLMYGLPGLDVDRWRRAVTSVLDWQPEHLSAYGLSLDAGSLWGATGTEGLPDEDAVIDQYWTLTREAAARGYEHYEISNYARAGFRSRHNLTYWRRGEYLGCGPGASGFVGDVRYTNVKAVSRYCGELEAGHLPIESGEHLTARQVLAERLFLGLRTADGVPRSWLDERMISDGDLARRITGWREAGLMRDADGRVHLTEAGFLVSDSLFTELL